MEILHEDLYCIMAASKLFTNFFKFTHDAQCTFNTYPELYNSKYQKTCNTDLLKTSLTIYYLPVEIPQRSAFRQVNICKRD